MIFFLISEKFTSLMCNWIETIRRFASGHSAPIFRMGCLWSVAQLQVFRWCGFSAEENLCFYKQKKGSQTIVHSRDNRTRHSLDLANVDGIIPTKDWKWLWGALIYNVWFVSIAPSTGGTPEVCPVRRMPTMRRARQVKHDRCCIHVCRGVEVLRCVQEAD